MHTTLAVTILEIQVLDPRFGQEWPLPEYATAASAALDLRERGAKRALATMCIGVGQGIAIALAAA